MINRHLTLLRFSAFFFALVLFACSSTEIDETVEENNAEDVVDFGDLELVVLGNVQDAGSPQIGCKKECCRALFTNPDPTRRVVSLGIIDHLTQQTFLLEASPDLTSQLENLNQLAGVDLSKTPDAIFLTHAHIGHYTGLMFLGKEAMNANLVPVFSMPRMNDFLSTNGPWSQLVTNENIELNGLKADSSVEVNQRLTITPIVVPHRDEFSETVGFMIKGANKTALFIPDIDKWERWDRQIIDLIQQVDYAFIDGTFFDGEELNNRPMAEIPHPFIVESMDLFDKLSATEKAKVYFIHFNHTNPLLNESSEETKQVEAAGYHIARLGMRFQL